MVPNLVWDGTIHLTPPAYTVSTHKSARSGRCAHTGVTAGSQRRCTPPVASAELSGASAGAALSGSGRRCVPRSSPAAAPVGAPAAFMWVEMWPGAAPAGASPTPKPAERSTSPTPCALLAALAGVAAAASLPAVATLPLLVPGAGAAALFAAFVADTAADAPAYCAAGRGTGANCRPGHALALGAASGTAMRGPLLPVATVRSLAAKRSAATASSAQAGTGVI